MLDPLFAVGDIVRPIGAPDVHPKPIDRVLTTYEDDFDTPLDRTVYIVRGFRFLEHELVLVSAAAGQKGGRTDGR